MPSITPSLPPKTSPSSPALEPTKGKSSPSPLSEKQTKTIRFWAQTRSSQLNTQIQTFISLNFHIRCPGKIIREYREEWGFNKDREDKLCNEEIKHVREWAKEHLYSSNQEIHAYMKDTFGYSPNTTRLTPSARSNLGFAKSPTPPKSPEKKDPTPKNHYKDNRKSFLPLSKRQFQRLRVAALAKPNRTEKEIIALIQSLFQITYSTSYVNKHKAAWGFRGKKYIRKEEKSKLRMFYGTNPESSAVDLQDFVKNQFGKTVSKTTMEKFKSEERPKHDAITALLGMSQV